MSANAEVNMTELKISSIRVMSLEYTATVASVVVGVVSLAVSLLQMVIILYWKQLRSRQQILVFNVALGDALKSITLTVPTVRRLYFIANDTDGVTDQLSCVLWFLLTNISMSYAFPIIFSLSVERSLCIATPVWHRNHSYRLKVWSTVASAALAVVVGCTSLVGVDAATLSTDCSTLTSMPSTYTLLRDIYQDVFIGLILAVNLLTMLVLLHRYRLALRNRQSMHAFKRSIELEAVKTLAALLVVFFASLVATWLCLQLANALHMTVEQKTAISPVGGILSMLRGCFDGFTYFTFSNDYRQAFRAIFCRSYCKGKAVVPVSRLPNSHNSTM